MIEDAEKDKQSAEIFDALGHPTRIAILKALNQGPMGFADLKKRISIDSSGHLKHHLDKLDDLIKTDEYGKYCLSDQGKEALLTIQTIGKYDDDARFRDQIGLIIRALGSDSDSIQEIAIVQLSLFGLRTVPHLTSALAHAFDEASRPDDYDSISGGITGASLREKAEAERRIVGITKTLGIVNAPATVADIKKALPRPQAVEALAKIGNKEALEAVVEHLPMWYGKFLGKYKHYLEYESGRRYAGNVVNDKAQLALDDFVKKIFNLFGEEGIKKLQVTLQEGDTETKNVVAKILVAIGDPNSIPLLLAALDDEDFAVKTEAATSLYRLKATEALPKIVSELFKSQNRNLSEILAKAVLELGSLDDWLSISFHQPKTPQPEYPWQSSIYISTRPFDEAIINSGEKAVPRLTKLLQDSNPEIQREAAEMIAKIKRGEKYSGYSCF